MSSVRIIYNSPCSRAEPLQQPGVGAAGRDDGLHPAGDHQHLGQLVRDAAAGAGRAARPHHPPRQQQLRGGRGPRHPPRRRQPREARPRAEPSEQVHLRGPGEGDLGARAPVPEDGGGVGGPLHLAAAV